MEPPLRIYLDHAATTPMRPEAIAAVAEGMAQWANPSSPHAEGRAARAMLEDARGRIAAALGWSGEVILTSGASEAIALALRRPRPVFVGATEHDAVLRAAPGATRIAPRHSSPDGGGGPPAGWWRGAESRSFRSHRDLWMPLHHASHGPPPPLGEELGGAVLDFPPDAIVAIQTANSETGVLQLPPPAGATWLADASQSAGKLPLPDADLIVVSAHKLGGPPGIGALLVRDLALLEPSGGQERGYRGGTENLPGALGFAAALEAPRDGFAGLAALRAELDSAVRAGGGTVIADAAPRIPTIASYRMPGLSAAAQLIRFDMMGFAVSAGSACSSGSLKPSHVLAAMGIAPEEAAEVVRVSFGWTTTAEDVARFAEALAAMLPWLESQHANPHSPHRPGRMARAGVEVARDQVAALLPSGGQVAFTSGATEALNWAIKGTSGPIVTIATEHAAVLDTVAASGRPVTILPVGADGLVDLDRAAEAIRPGTGLVAAMLVNNEIGVVQPIAALADLAHAAGAKMLCDAVQGYGRLVVPETCDLVAVSAHKVHGPKGVGALWVREGLTLAPLLHGGGQEAPGRSGTLSPALCAGFGAAARLMGERLVEDAAHVERLWDRVWGRFEAAGWRLNGSATARYRGNLNVRRAGLDVNRLMSDLRTLAFSAGSACASGSGRPSHVLRALGLSDAEARSSIRLGFGRYTGEAELMAAVDAIVAAP